jgi:hypothetical protein
MARNTGNRKTVIEHDSTVLGPATFAKLIRSRHRCRIVASLQVSMNPLPDFAICASNQFR